MRSAPFKAGDQGPPFLRSGGHPLGLSKKWLSHGSPVRVAVALELVASDISAPNWFSLE